MPDELLFTVDGTTAVPAQPLTLAEAGLLERKHLQIALRAGVRVRGRGPSRATSTARASRTSSSAAAFRCAGWGGR
jgi:hypothetical protein